MFATFATFIIKIRENKIQIRKIMCNYFRKYCLIEFSHYILIALIYL